jgi:hypothetical protein
MFFFFSFSDLFFNKGRLILVKKYNNSSFEKTNTHKHLGLFNRRGGGVFGLNLAAMRVLGSEPHPLNNGNAMPCSTGRLCQG